MTMSVQIGDLQVKLFSDGLARTSVENAIGISRQDSEALVGKTQEGWFHIPVNNFLFERDGKTILIDAGTGSLIQPTLGKLPENLIAGGVQPSAVTHILLTHLHPDHANGLIDEHGAAVYPHAEILIHANELEFWMSEGSGNETPKLKATRLRNQRNMAPYLDRTRAMRDWEEFLGCTPILSAGHTPGHTCWRIDANRESFLAWGDTVHFSHIQIPRPEIAVTYDLDPDQARKSRLRMLEISASERTLIAGAHVDAPGLGYIVRKGSGFAFEPLASAT